MRLDTLLTSTVCFVVASWSESTGMYIARAEEEGLREYKLWKRGAPEHPNLLNLNARIQSSAIQSSVKQSLQKPADSIIGESERKKSTAAETATEVAQIVSDLLETQSSLAKANVKGAPLATATLPTDSEDEGTPQHKNEKQPDYLLTSIRYPLNADGSKTGRAFKIVSNERIDHKTHKLLRGGRIYGFWG